MKAILLILLFVLLSGSAHARTLALEWKEVEGATHYEVRLVDEEGAETLDSVRMTTFEKTLPPGRYSYSIRSWDRLGRASKWSDPVAVEVEPLTPNPVFPVDQEIQLGPSKRGFELEWDPTEGGDAFEYEIERDNEPFASKKAATTRASFEPTEPGPYRWRVRSVREKTKSNTRKKPLRGPWSDWSPFTVLFPNLATPVLDTPRPDSTTTEYTEIALSWSAVPGAAGYEVSWGADSPKIVQKTHTKIVVPYGARTKIEVKALASTKFPERFVSEPAEAVLDLRPFSDWQLRSKFQLAYSTGRYTFENLSAAGNLAANASGGFSQFSVHSDTVLNQRWSVHTTTALHLPYISGGINPVPRASVSARFRHVFPNPKWTLAYGGGLYGATNLDFTTDRGNGSASGPAVKRITTFGVLLESSLEWRFHKKWKVDSVLAVAVPVVLKDAPAGSTLVPSFSQMRLGVTLGYHATPTWAPSLGVGLERNAIFYRSSGSAESTEEFAATLRLGLSFVFP